MISHIYTPAAKKLALPLVILLVFVALLLTVMPVLAGGRPLEASLSGAVEVPGPGDPDGSGTAHITLNQGQGKVCFELSVSNITLPAAAAHIHPGVAGVANPPIVTLTPPTTGFSSGCVDASPTLIKAIRQNPSDYYVNVHNSDFPGGAVRGQLSK